MKKNTTRRALLTSALSLLLCVSMLIGTTFAWFTDNASSVNNVIVSGNLDVELEYSTDMTTWNTVTSTTNIFKENALWEPGYTEVVYLRVTNAGNLALKYKLGVKVASETPGKTRDGDVEFKLSDFIEYGVVENVTAAYEADTDAGRKAAKAAVTAPQKLNTAFEKELQLEKKADSDTYALVVYMPESVTNEANHNGSDIPSINLGLSVNATQLASEYDSFGNDYDDAAWVVANADAKASNAAELSDALQQGGLIALTSDIEGDVTLDDIAENTIVNFAGNTINGTVTVAEGQSVTLNGVGGVNATGSDPAIALDKNTNVTLAGGTYTSEDEAINIKNRTEAPMTLTIEEGTVITAPTIVWLDSSSNYAGANIVINGGEFNSTYEKSDARPIKVHGGNVTINGGTFTIDNPTGANCYFVDISSTYNTATDGTNNKYIMGNVEINGGTFKSNVPYTRAVFASISRGHTLGTVVINDGYFEFTADNSYLIDVPSNVVVNDCTYIGVKSANVFNISSTNPTDQTIVVNGGNYTVRTSPAGCFNYTYANRVILKGGTINSDKKLTDSLADGYKVVDNGNGTYSIVAE